MVNSQALNCISTDILKGTLSLYMPLRAAFPDMPLKRSFSSSQQLFFGSVRALYNVNAEIFPSLHVD